MPPTVLALLLLAVVSPLNLEKSCNAGNAGDCLQFGIRIHDGIGVRRDPARAADLFRKACKGNNQDGCADDAFALAVGEGQAPNPRTAIPKLEKMCKQGQARACGNLGALFMRGALHRFRRCTQQTGCIGSLHASTSLVARPTVSLLSSVSQPVAGGPLHARKASPEVPRP